MQLKFRMKLLIFEQIPILTFVILPQFINSPQLFIGLPNEGEECQLEMLYPFFPVYFVKCFPNELAVLSGAGEQGRYNNVADIVL